MFKTTVGVDIGSKNTVLALRDGCFSEPSVIAAGTGGRGGVFIRAVGASAGFEEYGRVEPVKNGCPANVKLTSLLLADLIKKHLPRSSPRRMELYAALPKVMPPQRVRAFEKAAEAAGFHGFRVLDRMLMGALGAGIDISSSTASMVVDIGAQTVCCAAIGSGGLIYESMENFGSELAERAIQNYFSAVHRVHIGSRSAEVIKRNLDRLGFTVDARSIDDRLPRAVESDARSLRLSALTGMKSAVSFAADTLSHLPPEVCADILEGGVTLIGGGAKMHGLCELFERELGVKTRTVENAGTAAADGMRRYLFLSGARREARLNEYVLMRQDDAALTVESL